MKLFTVSSGLLVAAFYSVFVLSFVGCEKTVDDAVLGNSVYLNPSDENLVAALFRQVITPEHEGNKAAYRDAFEKVLRLIRTSFDQDLDVTGNQDMISSKGKNDGTTSSSSGSRKLNRRSVEAPLTKGDDEETRSTRVPDSGFPKQPSNPNGKRIPDPRDVSPHPPPMSSSVDRVESQHTATYPREPAVYPPAANVDPNSYKPTPLEIKLEKFLDEYEPHHDDNSLLNLLSNIQLGNIGLPGLPGQPIRRFLHGIFQTLAISTRPTETIQESIDRFPGKLFVRGRSAANTMRENTEGDGLGIHKEVKVGPFSVRLDVGRS